MRSEKGIKKDSTFLNSKEANKQKVSRRVNAKEVNKHSNRSKSGG